MCKWLYLVGCDSNRSDSITEKSPVKGAGQKKLLVAGADLQLAVAIKPYSALRHFLRISLRTHQHDWGLRWHTVFRGSPPLRCPIPMRLGV